MLDKLKILVLGISMFCVNNLVAQAPDMEWQKSFGGSGIEEASGVQQTTDGGYIIVGFTQSNNANVTGNHGGKDVWIIKVDVTGNLQWQKALGGSGNDEAFNVQQTSDGGYIFAGYTSSVNGNVTGNHGNDDAWVVKLDANGNIQWQKALGGTLQDRAADIRIAADGGYIIAGFTMSNDGDVTLNHGWCDVWIVKLNSEGNKQWDKTLGGTYCDVLNCIDLTSDGGFIISGNTNSEDGDVNGGNSSINNYDIWAAKLDASGTIQWQKTLGGSDLENAYSIQQTPDGGYFTMGFTASGDGDVTGYHGNGDMWAIKLNASGNIEWQKALGGSLIDYGYSALLTADGGYILGGFTGANDGDVVGNHGNCDFWILKLNAAGNIQWQKTMGGTLMDRAVSIKKTTDNGYVLAGYAWSNDGDITQNYGNDDFWVVKLSPDQSLSTDGYDKGNMVLYPNPADTVINLSFPGGVTAERISVSDITGKIVVVQDGNNRINTENLASGFYFVQAYLGQKVFKSRFIKD